MFLLSCAPIGRVMSTGYIHYDIKPGNVLAANNCLRAIDFDDSFFNKPGFDVATRKTCFFVTLLLITMHLRTMNEADFYDVYVSMVRKVLLEIWDDIVNEAVDTGSGASFLAKETIATSRTSGAFEGSAVPDNGPEGLKMSRRLRCMNYEYFMKSGQRRVREWTRWKAEKFVDSPKLVPQMLQYALFYETADDIPMRYRRILAY